ncbi:hypothetical protein KAT67_02170 [candidate division WOR-3 bacterium]|jgi:hypothetical protein|nr:hypothetical protein [candidate division WOR-3 bacterium]
MQIILFSFITFVLGIIITHLWTKYKTRIKKIKYNVQYQYLGASVDDTRFGSVKLLYNDKPIKCLYNAKVLLSNESHHDISDMEINIVCDPDSTIILSFGRNTSSFNELAFTKDYGKVLNEGKNLVYIFTRRDYMLPVLNRGDKVEILLLMTNVHNKQPIVEVNCDYAGVRMKYSPKAPYELFGESLQHCSLLGSFITLLLCISIVLFIGNRVIAVFLAAVIALFASLVGFAFIKIIKFLTKLLS